MSPQVQTSRLQPLEQLRLHFVELQDPRVERTKLHQLLDVVTIAICAVICGADDWSEIELFGNSKRAFFEQFLVLPNGIPSHDTFNRVFARVDPQQFRECFGVLRSASWSGYNTGECIRQPNQGSCSHRWQEGVRFT